MARAGFLALVASLMLLPTPAVAQPIPAGQKVGLARYLQAGYAGIKRDLLEEAERMPEADYGFKPGSMAEVRTFGQIFAHVADGQFSTCAAVRGVPNPNQGKNLEQVLKSKAEFVKALADSFAFCDEAFATLTDASTADFVKVGPGEVVKGAVLAGLLIHSSAMYGIGTVYLRAKNLVPPASERAARRGRGGR